MASHRRTGALRERLVFQKRGDLVDDWGGVTPGTGPFDTELTVYANLTPRTGGEEVTAARLSGRQPYVCTVRNTPDTRRITTAWRAVYANDATRVMAVKSPPADPDGKNAWLEFLVELGESS